MKKIFKLLCVCFASIGGILCNLFFGPLGNLPKYYNYGNPDYLKLLNISYISTGILSSLAACITAHFLKSIYA